MWNRGAYAHPLASMAGMKIWRSIRSSPGPQCFFLCASVSHNSLTEAEDTTCRCQRPPLWFPETWGQDRTGGDLQWQPWGRKWHIGLNLLPVQREHPYQTEGKSTYCIVALWTEWLSLSLYGKSLIFLLQVTCLKESVWQRSIHEVKQF